jgi:hypothetical protein
VPSQARQHDAGREAVDEDLVRSQLGRHAPGERLQTGLGDAVRGATCVGRRGFLPLLAADAIDVATVDVQWTGGLTEARTVATLADAYGIPVAPHDCTGPVSFAACVHLVLSQPNGLIQETVRAFRHTWYGAIASGLPTRRLPRMP